MPVIPPGNTGGRPYGARLNFGINNPFGGVLKSADRLVTTGVLFSRHDIPEEMAPRLPDFRRWAAANCNRLRRHRPSTHDAWRGTVCSTRHRAALRRCSNRRGHGETPPRQLPRVSVMEAVNRRVHAPARWHRAPKREAHQRPTIRRRFHRVQATSRGGSPSRCFCLSQAARSPAESVWRAFRLPWRRWRGSGE